MQWTECESVFSWTMDQTDAIGSGSEAICESDVLWPDQ
jgi:hypothetical protein